MGKRYARFRTDLPVMCKRLRLRARDLSFGEYVVQVEEWLKLHVELEASS